MHSKITKYDCQFLCFFFVVGNLRTVLNLSIKMRTIRFYSMLKSRQAALVFEKKLCFYFKFTIIMF